MTNREISRQLQRLRATIKKAPGADEGDDELMGHWGRYCCVLSAGFLENALSLLYIDYVKRTASPNVVSYATKRLDRIQNPKASRFVDTAREFNATWAEELEAFLEEDGRRDAINSIMANRHLVAHGKTASISVGRVDEYLKKSVQVLDFIERQLV